MEENLDSCVTFKIISELTGRKYKMFIGDLLFGYLSWVDPSLNQLCARDMAYLGPWNNESGMGVFYIMGTYIGHLKLYLHDEEQPYYDNDRARSIVFRDHYSKYDVEKVYLVADTFEMFLKSKGVGYTRHNRMR